MMFLAATVSLLNCALESGTQASIPKEHCIKEKVRLEYGCSSSEAAIDQTCQSVIGSMWMGTITWPGISLLNTDHAPKWLAMQSPEDEWDYRILMVGENCDFRSVRNVQDIGPWLPRAPEQLPFDSLLELAHVLLGIRLLDRAIPISFHGDSEDPRVEPEMSQFGCNLLDPSESRGLSRSGLPGELREFLSQFPRTETKGGTAKVSFLCRFDDVDGRIEVVEASVSENGTAGVVFEYSGFSLRDGEVYRESGAYRIH
jgi:hypothetical protein